MKNPETGGSNTPGGGLGSKPDGGSGSQNMFDDIAGGASQEVVATQGEGGNKSNY